MKKQTAEYIWDCITSDSVYYWGLPDWCYDRSIEVSDFEEFEKMVADCIDDLED